MLNAVSKNRGLHITAQIKAKKRELTPGQEDSSRVKRMNNGKEPGRWSPHGKVELSR